MKKMKMMMKMILINKLIWNTIKIDYKDYQMIKVLKNNRAILTIMIKIFKIYRAILILMILFL